MLELIDDNFKVYKLKFLNKPIYVIGLPEDIEILKRVLND